VGMRGPSCPATCLHKDPRHIPPLIPVVSHTLPHAACNEAPKALHLSDPYCTESKPSRPIRGVLTPPRGWGWGVVQLKATKETQERREGGGLLNRLCISPDQTFRSNFHGFLVKSVDKIDACGAKYRFPPLHRFFLR